MNRKNVLLVEGKRIYRDLFGAFLEKLGYQSLAAADGAAALELLYKQDVALILLDVEAGVGGLDWLARLRRSGNQTPVVILTDVQERSLVIRAAMLGVQDYILKGGLSSQRLEERIAQLIAGRPASGGAPPAPEAAASQASRELAAAATPTPAKPNPRLDKAPIGGARGQTPALGAPAMTDWPRLLTRDKTLQRLDTVAGGRTIAGVVAQVVAAASSPNADLPDMVRIIQSDPVLASRILHMANSAATGARARVQSIEDAARTIGIRGIQNMAISIGIFGAFPPDERDGFSTMCCWQHSFAVAELMGRIVRQRNPELEGLNHLVGLCHDLGEILLRQHFAAEHKVILGYALEHHLPIHLVESTGLGIRRPELISRLLTKVGLPPNVVDGIREFHERQIKEQAGGISAGTQLLQIANLLAHGLLLTPTTHEEVRPLTRTEWRLLGSDKAPPEIAPAALRNEIILATNVLARLPGPEEERLIKPPLAPTGLRIGYVRPEMFIGLDPLGCALDVMAETQVFSALPTVEQMADLDGLVAVGVRPGVTPVDGAELAQLAAAVGMPELPMLVLTGQPGQEIKGTLAQRLYPVQLGELHTWLLGALNSKRAMVA